MNKHLFGLVNHSSLKRRFVGSILQQQQRRSMSDKTFLVPSMGDSITEGTLSRWEKKIGDFVNENDTFAVIETDKVSVDVTASGFAGILTEQLAAPGATVKVGDVLAKFQTKGVTAPAAGK